MRRYLLALFTLVHLSRVALCDNATALSVSVPIIAPSNSQALVSTVLSFSIEQDRWPDWVGIDSRNQFTFNALQNFAELTGQPPNIRVGANSEDHTIWSPTVTVRSFQRNLYIPVLFCLNAIERRPIPCASKKFLDRTRGGF